VPAARRKKKKRTPSDIKVAVPMVVSVRDDGKVETYVVERVEDELTNPTAKQRHSIEKNLLDESFFHNSVTAAHVVWLEARVPVPKRPKAHKVSAKPKVGRAQ